MFLLNVFLLLRVLFLVYFFIHSIKLLQDEKSSIDDTGSHSYMSFTVMAQQNTGKQGRRAPAEMRWDAKERSADMAKQLNLSYEQKTKVEALFEKQDAKRKEMMAKHQENREAMTQDREARRAEMMKMRDQAVAENDD